jgi:hypothetical protein
MIDRLIFVYVIVNDATVVRQSNPTISSISCSLQSNQHNVSDLVWMCFSWEEDLLTNCREQIYFRQTNIPSAIQEVFRLL